MEIKDQILKAYEDVGYSKTKIIGHLKKQDIKVTQKQVNEALSGQETEQLHKRQTKRVSGHITAFIQDEKHQIDLLDMSTYTRDNKGYKWIMIVVDVFSRRAYAEPLKSKTSNDVLNGLKKYTSIM